MASAIKDADNSELAAVSSRVTRSAQAFADANQVGRAFDSWADMIAWDGVDAIYVATPTSTREAICIDAAKNGKHVLCEKPFASLASLQRIITACREQGVGFMDGTHFSHHPRTHDIRSRMPGSVGWPCSLDSSFQFNLEDRGNIRFDPELEPLGAIGDAGWYNMRAIVEYLPPDAGLVSASTYLRRDDGTGAVIHGGGVMLFDDGSLSTWSCGFDSGGVSMDLRIAGANGVIRLDDFISHDDSARGTYTLQKGDFSTGPKVESITIAANKPGPSLMFEAFALMVTDKAEIEHNMRLSEHTQRLLDAAWKSGLENEQGQDDSK